MMQNRPQQPTSGYPPFGLTTDQAETLIRLASAIANGALNTDGTPDYGHAYHEALCTFPDPDEVEYLALRTFTHITNRTKTGELHAGPQ